VPPRWVFSATCCNIPSPDPDDMAKEPTNLALFGWKGETTSRIQDLYYAEYVIEGADICQRT
jgi:hypothetical protein